jgi:hypothetical protein
MNCMNKLAIATLAATLAFGWATASNAEDQPSDKDAAQPAATVQPAASGQPAAASQPTADERLQELEKEVSALQAEIASLKDDTAGLKTAALVQPIATPHSAADDAPQKVTVGSLLGPVTLSGEVDGYYAFNFNQPAALGFVFPDGQFGNALRFFDQNTQQFSLNAVELVVDKAPDATAGGFGRAGFHAGAIYGQAAETINGVAPFLYTPPSNSTDASNLALKEAYIDYLAPIGKGLTFTFGKFVTPAGAEVIESNANWNYSRSILFYYAIPYFHFGANAKYTFNSKWSLTGYLVNNWNGTQQFNTGKTYGASLAWTPTAKWAVTENYLAGPQCDACYTGYVGKPNDNWRQLEDATIAYTPNTKWAFQINGDYDYGDKIGNRETISGNSKAVDWWGAAGYVKYTFNSKTYVAVRYEYLSDPQGFTTGTSIPNLHVAEGTATLGYNWTGAFQTRLEFRDDYSNHKLFQKGGCPLFVTCTDSPAKYEFTQPVVEVGFIYTFSSANAPK